MNFFSRYGFHFLIVLIAWSSILLLDFFVQSSSQGIIYPDSFSYMESARNLFVFHRGHNYRPILMAIINGIPYLFGAKDQFIYQFGVLTNFICFAGFFVVFFEIAKNYFKRKTAFWLTIFSIFFFGNIALVFHLLTENIFMFGFIVGYYFLMLYYKSANFKFLAFSITVFLLLMLIKPGAKLYAILLFIYFSKIIWKNIKSKYNWAIYGALFLIFVQCAGLKYQFGNFTLSYIDSVTYYNYLGSKAKCIEYGKEYEQINNPRAEYIFSFECKDQAKIASEDFIFQIKNNTENLLKAYIQDFIENSKTGNTCIEDCKNVLQRSSFSISKAVIFGITKWQNRLFTLLGILASLYFILMNIKKPNLFFWISIYLVMNYAVSGISCGQGDRFHVITFPLVVLLLAKIIQERKWFTPFFEPLQK